MKPANNVTTPTASPTQEQYSQKWNKENFFSTFNLILVGLGWVGFGWLGLSWLGLGWV